MEFIHPNEGVPFLLPRRASRAMAGVLFFLASGIVYVTVEASRDLSPSRGERSDSVPVWLDFS